jgi:hypothetical protein
MRNPRPNKRLELTETSSGYSGERKTAFVYRYTINDLGATLFCTVKLTKDDKIADFQLSLEWNRSLSGKASAHFSFTPWL